AATQTNTVADVAAADGNYYVNISLQGGCFVSLPYSIKFSPVHNLTLGEDRLICNQPSISLHATTAGVSKYQWQNGSIDSVFAATASGNYSVIAQDSNGCSKTASVNIEF